MVHLEEYKAIQLSRASPQCESLDSCILKRAWGSAKHTRDSDIALQSCIGKTMRQAFGGAVTLSFSKLSVLDKYVVVMDEPFVPMYFH
jgi:hypothetical protein